MRDDSALFFICSLIEYIGRIQKRKRGEIVDALGDGTLRRIYKYADVLHCEPIMKTADEYIRMQNITEGDFDNVGACEDVQEGDVVYTLKEVYGSWISDAISNYNTDFFYQSREYIRECYREGVVLD